MLDALRLDIHTLENMSMHCQSRFFPLNQDVIRASFYRMRGMLTTLTLCLCVCGGGWLLWLLVVAGAGLLLAGAGVAGCCDAGLYGGGGAVVVVLVAGGVTGGWRWLRWWLQLVRASPAHVFAEHCDITALRHRSGKRMHSSDAQCLACRDSLLTYTS